MEDQNIFVGQEFPDVKAFRGAIKEVAIAQHFELRIVKSDLIRYIAKCASEGCPWRIRAIKLPNAPTFTIRSLEGTHTCGKNAHHQASVDWIVNFIEERLRDNINYKPKDILHDIYKQYGITIPYKQAWRAKERGLQAIYGSSEEGYCLLPAYCEQIKKTNPESHAEVFTAGSDSRFQRFFISFYSSLHGFLNGCLPVICLGGIQLKSKYLGTLLSATSFDADGGVFPLAFGVVDEENDDSWMWFLLELRKALEMSTENIPPFTFLSDGQKSIADAVDSKFSSSSHAICMQYLSESISKEFKNSRLVQLLWKAAYSTSTTGFKEIMAEFNEVSSDAAMWLQQYPPSRWALIHFDGTRYGHFSSNINEFNKWILEARELPIIQVIKRIHCKLIEEFELRRSRSITWSSTLAPSAEKHIMEGRTRASTYKALRSDEVEFEVISAERSDIVNLGTRSCSCRDWQLYRIPCSHAVAAIVSCKKDVYAYTEKYFTAASYRESYSKEVHPIPDKLEWSRTRLVRPPKFRRPPGRPEKKRLCVEDLNREKHTVHCSKCNQIGHYKTTCKTEVDHGAVPISFST
ncbi:hypothetical protein RND71_037324 [Anisodus tanguticus]|uniref:SWIM-type domain-containing protein n=1 Tax=Anisodus tanguticus TaxID=243964 RepID=A0AAE1V163_9SOLA|nr:hypothetical protein RND71_037324 [Anisodus tanguticus]